MIFIGRSCSIEFHSLRSLTVMMSGGILPSIVTVMAMMKKKGMERSKGMGNVEELIWKVITNKKRGC